MGGKRNPLDVLEKDDEIVILERKKPGRKKYLPNWELILPGGTVFQIFHRETAVISSLMKELLSDFSNRGLVLRRETYGRMTEHDWRDLGCRPSNQKDVECQTEELLELVKTRIEEEKIKKGN